MAVILSENLLSRLKEQIKAEIMQEMNQRQPASTVKYKTPWDEMKDEIIEKTEPLNLTGPDQYQLIAAFSCIVRNIFKVRMVKFLPDEKVPDAKRLVTGILEFIERGE